MSIILRSIGHLQSMSWRYQNRCSRDRASFLYFSWQINPILSYHVSIQEHPKIWTLIGEKLFSYHPTMDRDQDTFQLSTDSQLAQVNFLSTLSQTLSFQEAADISERFQSNEWIPNGQVLWSGVPYEIAQDWAASHHLQTLTIAMGPLMNKKHPDCLKSKKTPHEWSRYVHGASAVFAWHIAQGEKVTLLSPPPPRAV